MKTNTEKAIESLMNMFEYEEYEEEAYYDSLDEFLTWNDIVIGDTE